MTAKAAKDVVPQIITALTAIEGRVDGIKKSFDQVPGLISPLPAFVNFYDGAERDWPRMTNGSRETVYRIRAIALIGLQADTKNAEQLARPLDNAFTDYLDQHKELDNLVTAASVLEAAVVSSEYGPLQLQPNGETFLGVSFEVRVRTLESVTYRGAG